MKASNVQSPELTSGLLTDFASLKLLASDWERLWSANPNRQIFGKFSWIESWWEGYGGNARLFAPVVYHDGTCVGILPLYIEDRMLRFVGDPAADYNDLVCEPDRMADVLSAAIRELDKSQVHWDSCTLENVPQASLLLQASRDLPSSLRERIVSSVSAVCPTVLLDDNRAETLKSILGKSTVSRRIKQLEKLGSLKFRHLDDRVQAREHLPSFYEQHIRCRTLAGIRSQLLDPQSKAFFEALVDKLDPRGELRFAVLESNDRPIAYNFGFQLDGKFLYYTPTFDIEFFDVSPGDVLLRYLFIYARDNDVREFDFTVGDETYKSRYANHTNHNYVVLLYPRSTTGRISQFAHTSKERLRSYPSAYRATKSAASAASESATRIVRVLRRDGLVRAAAKAVVALFRLAIYARDEVLVLKRGKKVLSTPSQPLTFRVATLSDLADSAVRYPEYLGSDSVHDLRERIKKGHTPFVALEDGNIVHIAWLRIEDRIVTSEIGEDFALELGRPVGIIYDAWTPQIARGRGIYPAVISLIAERIQLMGLEQWVYVLSDNAASRRGLEKAGMEVQYRMIQTTWFHWIRRRVNRQTAV